MANPNLQLIKALRNTAFELAKSRAYQWGHMGSCNCGYLAQEITKLTKSEIHNRAMQKHGDWNEQLNDYCPTSGFLMDDMISDMLDAGLDTNDLKHLEKLSDKRVLSRLPLGVQLHHNYKNDVVTYLKLWAQVLEDELLRKVKINELKHQPIAENV